jgi:hypothetical protein
MAQLLLDSDYLIDHSVIDNNVDFKRLSLIIETVQDLHIQPVLGTKLYKEILTQSVPPATGLTPANKTLLDDHILKAMTLYVLAKAPVVFKYRYMNKGVMVKNAENASAIDLSEVKFLNDNFTSDAQMYLERMRKFILNNIADYPSFYNGNGLDEELPISPIQCDVYLPELHERKHRNDMGELNI